MSLSSRLSVRGKLVLLLALPLAGYAYFNLHDTWSQYQALAAKGLIQKGFDFAEPLWRSFIFDFIASFVVWMVTFFLVYRISLWITRPLKSMAEGLGKSDLTLELAVESEDEIAQVAIAFNAYNARLRSILDRKSVV